MDKVGNEELYVLLYLNDWQDDGKIFPSILGHYKTEKEAYSARNSKIDPEKYFVRRSWLMSFE